MIYYLQVCQLKYAGNDRELREPGRQGAPWAYIISATLPQISPYLNSFQKTLFQNNFPWCRIAIMSRISTGNQNRSNPLTSCQCLTS